MTDAMEEQVEISSTPEEKAKEEFLKAREQLRGSLQEYMTIPELLGEHSGEKDTAGRLDLSELKVLEDGQHSCIGRHPDKHRAFCDTNGPHNVFKVSKATLSTLYKAGCRAIGDGHSASDENAARFCDSVLGNSSGLDVQGTPDHSKECPSKKFHSARILATLLWCGLDFDAPTWRNYLRLMPGPAFCDCWLPFESSYTPTLRGLCKDRPAESGEIYDAQWRFTPLVFKANQLKPQRFINHQVNYRLPISEYRLIGEGNFGRVYKVKIENKHLSGSESEEYALKDIGSRSSGGPAKEWEVAAAIFRCTTEHKHIAAIRASFFVLDRTLLVLDLAAGDLESFMEHCEPPLDSEDRKKLMSAMAGVGDALAWLQQNMNVEGRHVSCLHLDFKADNVLVFGAPSLRELKSAQATFKISDFGISRVYHDTPNGMKEDRQYNLFRQSGQTSRRTIAAGDNSCPPEFSLKDESYETLCYRDVWSYGCVLARFMHWIVGGRELVHAFDNFRLYPDLGDMTDVEQTDRFFKQVTVSPNGLKDSDLILRSDDKGGLEVCRLKERVRGHFKLLLQELARNKVDKEELGYFGAVIELLEEKVLVPNILHANQVRRDSTRSDVSILRGLLTGGELHQAICTRSLPSSQDLRSAAHLQPDEAFRKDASVEYKRTRRGSRSSSFLAERASHESAASGLSPKSVDSEKLQFAIATPHLSPQWPAVRSSGTLDISNNTGIERTHSSDVIRPPISIGSSPAATGMPDARARDSRAHSDSQLFTSSNARRTLLISSGWRLPLRRILEPSNEKKYRHKVPLEGCLASPQISPDGRYVALMKRNTIELHNVGDASCNGLEPCQEPLLLASRIDNTHWTAFCFNDAALCGVAESVGKSAETQHAVLCVFPLHDLGRSRRHPSSIQDLPIFLGYRNIVSIASSTREGVTWLVCLCSAAPQGAAQQSEIYVFHIESRERPDVGSSTAQDPCRVVLQRTVEAAYSVVQMQFSSDHKYLLWGQSLRTNHKKPDEIVVFWFELSSTMGDSVNRCSIGNLRHAPVKTMKLSSIAYMDQTILTLSYGEFLRPISLADPEVSRAFIDYKLSNQSVCIIPDGQKFYLVGRSSSNTIKVSASIAVKGLGTSKLRPVWKDAAKGSYVEFDDYRSRGSHAMADFAFFLYPQIPNEPRKLLLADRGGRIELLLLKE